MVKSVPSALVALGALLLLVGIIFFLANSAYAAIAGTTDTSDLPIFNLAQAWAFTLGGLGFIALGVVLYAKG